jgi:hypothetical protein
MITPFRLRVIFLLLDPSEGFDSGPDDSATGTAKLSTSVSSCQWPLAAGKFVARTVPRLSPAPPALLTLSSAVAGTPSRQTALQLRHGPVRRG